MKMNTIFNLKLFVVLLSFMAFSACEKDKDDKANEKDLIGLWTINSSSTEMTVNGKDMIDFLVDEMGFTQSEAEQFATFYETELTGTMEFKSDGTYKAIDDGDTTEGTWELSSDKTKIIMDKGTADEDEASIISFSSSKMTLEISMSETMDVDGDEVDDTLLIKMRVNLSK